MSEQVNTSLSSLQLDTPALKRYRLWRYTKDHLATVAIAAGGSGVLLAILLIFFYLMYEVLPLFYGATVEKTAEYTLSSVEESLNKNHRSLYLAIEEQNEIAFRLSAAGEALFFNAKNGQEIDKQSLLPQGTQLEAFALSSDANRIFALALKDGGLLIAKHNYQVSYPNDKRQITPRIDYPYGETPLSLLESGQRISKLAFRDDEEQMFVAAVIEDSQLKAWRFSKEEDFLTEEMVLEKHKLMLEQGDWVVRDLAIDIAQRWLYVVTEDQRLLVYDLAGNEGDKIAVHSRVDFESPVVSVKMLLGGISLLSSHENGEVQQWFMSRDEAGQPYLAQVRKFQGEGKGGGVIAVEQRRKGFVTVSKNGELDLFHSTAQRKMLSESVSISTALNIALSPRANVLLIETANGKMANWHIDNEHPEVSWAALWSKVWYESYDTPDYIWQSSAATNDFEPKYSLMPLAFGTLKAAFYAMLLGAPLAICGAIYTAYFMSPALRRKVKPLVELMEALPTVILGFLAGLWLAPFMESNLTSVFMLLLCMPLGILLVSYLYHKLPANVRHSVPEGWEGVILIPIVLLIGWLCIASNGQVESLLFGGDMRAWVTNELGVSFDQRNALVVGIAMGFAVIPTIFSITEDAIFSVPAHLSHGSLALGATRWQTLVGVVLPTASPGIFSALMIGLGRAVGETMIVLMATGNTPIMDMNIFEGMRTLAANIAVEVPEAEVASSHYRVLFLAAFVLFGFTFVVNTGAEIIRHRLRKKYGSL